MAKAITCAFYLVGMFLAGEVVAQLPDSTELDLEQFAERIFQVQGVQENYEDLYESLLLYYTTPLNLNEVSRAELASLYLLSPQQLGAFFDYRSEQGKLLSIYELQSIPGFDQATIERMLPFAAVSPPLTAVQLSQKPVQSASHTLLFRWTKGLEIREGYRPRTTVQNGDTFKIKPYAGSSDKIYGRFRSVLRNRYSLGITFEKDAGEALTFDNGQWGYDYVSAHFLMEQKHQWVARWIVGDYQLQVGQGLVFGAGFNPGKGAETVEVIPRNTLGIRPYTSVVETGFFRGAAVTLNQKKWYLTLLYSMLAQDGTGNDPDSLSDEAAVNSILNSGLHRTESERSGRNAVLEQNAGAVLWHEVTPMVRIGATWLRTSFDSRIDPTEKSYNQFYFRGLSNEVGGLFVHANVSNATFFGEAARSSSGGIGALAGVVAAFNQAWSAAFAWRSYSRDYHSFYANGLAEGSAIRNEEGLYWGLKFRPSRKWNWTAYFDRFRFPWLRFNVDAPSKGYEWLSRLTFRPNKTWSTYWQIRQQQTEESDPEATLGGLISVVKTNYLINLDYQANHWLMLRSRVQSSTQRAGQGFSKGYALVQDVNLTFERWRFSARMALFETDDFDNAQYVYERDVLYAFSIPAYSGRGSRNYAMVRYTINRSIDIWLRYAQTRFRDRDEIGSGLDAINGNLRSEIKAMLRWKF